MASKELKVEASIVQQKAQQMSTRHQQIVNTFGNIKLEIENLKSVWESDASRTFQNKFNGLQDDIQRMFGVAKEYSDDLIEIAKTYTQIEQEATQLEQTLTEDVFNV